MFVLWYGKYQSKGNDEITPRRRGENDRPCHTGRTQANSALCLAFSTIAGSKAVVEFPEEETWASD